ncbi:type II secretion system protein [Niallia endozanthoxylica]|uniref:Type II secretion system protein n=1 Tax=Niallia endozanthoxylica TaxID=2036016 RepID=A0A5J5I6B4_9BACI|nr:type II secretion system protein [Niallia endozanthoxylica]KAA9029455.1 type II secretion system protein [Niallia endozanthoxylica]
MRNERGFTLIELLAIIVILGIMAAIAIPIVGQIINHSKADAHLSNARQMLHAGKMAYANGYMPESEYSGERSYTMEDLIKEGFLDGKIANPSITSTFGGSDSYDPDESLVVVYVTDDTFIFKVNLSVAGEYRIFNEPQTLEQISRDVFTEDFKNELNLK